MKNHIRVTMFLAALATATMSTHATVLTFEKSPTQFAYPDRLWGTPSATEYPDYGDNVTGSTQDVSAARGQLSGTTVFQYGTVFGPTPGIVADYTNQMFTYSDAGGFASSSPIMLAVFEDGIPRRMITLSGTNEALVSLQQFSLGHPAAGSVTQLSVVRINDDLSETTLWSTNNFTVTGGLAGMTFNTANFGGPLIGKRIAIDFDPVANHNNYWFDNIGFGEIPEPSSIMLLATGTLLLMRRRP